MLQMVLLFVIRLFTIRIIVADVKIQQYATVADNLTISLRFYKNYFFLFRKKIDKIGRL